MKRLAALLLFLAVSANAAPPTPGTKTVLALTIHGVINPIVAEYVEKGLAVARDGGASAVLIRLDTPGGLLDATRSAISALINSRVPVIVYVAPLGARATSAGAFLMMAADVAAMAPETHLGAAHPVDAGEKAPEAGTKNGTTAMDEKMVSDAAAYIRALASERGRNAAWAEKAVRDSVSLTAREALDQNVIDVIAGSEEELLKSVSGRTVRKGGAETKLDLAGATVVECPMTGVQKFLHVLGHPNVAYILLTIGVYGLIYELAAPGIGLGGGVGAVCLLLAFFSLQILPLSAVGLSLLALGVLLLVLELMMPSHGLLTLGGLLAFATGSFLMVDSARGLNFPSVSPPLILSTVGTTALFFGVAVRKVWIARHARPQTGAETLAGAIGTVDEALAPEGLVSLGGELWTARSTGASVEKGNRVRVVRREGNILVVEKTA